MADFDKNLIISLSKLLDETGLTEIEIENKEFGRVKVAKNLHIQNTPSPSLDSLNKIELKNDNNNNQSVDLSNSVKSPMVGTIYLKPDPESEPFINEGDRVKKGDTLLIIEAMKTMNNIPADKDGLIKKILVENEQPIQFGDPLVIIE